VNGNAAVVFTHSNVGSTARRTFAMAATALGREALLTNAGQYMCSTVVPMRFWAQGAAFGGLHWKPVLRGGSPLIDTGLLRQANTFVVRGSTLELRNSRPQARLQNRGGTVTPKHAKYLWVPLPTLSVTERRMPSSYFTDTFVALSMKGNLIVFQKLEGGTVRPIAVLKKKVKIDARPFMYFGAAAISSICKRWIAKVRKAGIDAAAGQGATA
jgi:hypothetical protein